jgi:lipoyl(octanoyl) transferase
MLMANQSTYKILNYYDLGMIDYKKAWDIQKEIFELRNENLIPDTLMLLEHPHTYTLGKVADKENLISTQKQLNDLGIKVYNIDRGGDITYHGPGQIVGYPIINLNNWRKDTHAYLRALEEIIILTCNEFGLAAKRNPKYTGVWIDDRKIAAIGIKVSRWITMHGFAFNVNTDLGYYGGIIPCGIKDKEVTSLKKELKKEIDMAEVKNCLIKNFKIIFEYSELHLLHKNNLFSILSESENQIPLNTE